MIHVIIEPTRIRDLLALGLLFEAATHSSFGYLPAEQQRAVIRQNRSIRLLAARLRPNRIVMSAKSQGKLYGYAIGGVENKIATLYWLYVDPEFRGHNVGLKLLAATRRHAEKLDATHLTLCTHDHRQYYQRQGFSHEGQQILHGISMDLMKLRIA